MEAASAALVLVAGFCCGVAALADRAPAVLSDRRVLAAWRRLFVAACALSASSLIAATLLFVASLAERLLS